MGRLEDRLLNHPVRGRIAHVRSVIGGLSDETRSAADQNTEGVILRMLAVLDFLDGVLVASDPMLVADRTLAAMDTELMSAQGIIDQLHDPAQAQNLDVQIDAVVSSASPLLTAAPFIVKRAKIVAEKFNTAVSEKVAELEVATDQLSEHIAVLETKRQEGAVEIAREDEVRRESLATAVNSLEARVGIEQQRLDQLVPTFEQQFNEAQDARKSSHDELRDHLQVAADETAAKLAEAANSMKTQLNDHATEVLDTVKKRKAEVEELYRVITDTSTAGGFNKEATNQRDQADAWRRITVGFGVGAAVVAIGSIAWAAFDASGASSAGVIAAKVTATVAAATIAAYAGRQSGRHRQREEDAKQLELQLVAFGPFIQDMEPDDQQGARKDFISRAFVGPSSRHTRLGLTGSRQDDFGVTPEFVELVTKIVRIIQ